MNFDEDDITLMMIVHKFLQLRDLSFTEFKILLNGLSLRDFEVKYKWIDIVRNADGVAFDKYHVTVPDLDKLYYKDCHIENKHGDIEKLSDSDMDNYQDSLYKIIEEVGGEGEGDYAHIIMEHVPSGRLLRLVGYYQSYQGYDWDGSEWVEVKPVEVLVTQYEDI